MIPIVSLNLSVSTLKLNLKKYEKKLKTYFWTEMDFYSSPLPIVSVLKY